MLTFLFRRSNVIHPLINGSVFVNESVVVGCDSCHDYLVDRRPKSPISNKMSGT